ncbi:MAG: epoxyqueuosine reductase QueH [Candidatus Omnitrophota bacterium]
MKLLLHACCAPCLIYPLGVLRENKIKVSAFFYNPNIHPFSEYENRLQAVRDFSQEENLEIFIPEYNPQDYFHQVNLKEGPLQRCYLCWRLRLKESAKQAKENGFNFFSTTLLASPYQDQEKIKEIGAQASREEGVDFYYVDFRSGFRQAHAYARLKGIYCQKYCGCLYSEIERKRKKSGK